MRDFRLQAAVDCVKILVKKEMTLWELLSYVWLWTKPTKSKKIQANKVFDRRDLSHLRGMSYKLAGKDPAWFPRLFEPTTLGIRAWEYGILLSRTSFRNKKVLDAGAGNSRLPLYLAKSGARVTMLDMENPLEETRIKMAQNLKFVLGDMTNTVFKSETFDRVLCISAIEHVDMKGRGFYQEDEYLERALTTIKELVRVTKKKGVFYLTTDFYLPEQKTDKWMGSEKQIRGAFPWRYIDQFVKTIEEAGVVLTNKLDYDESLLRRNSQMANYRGRYFSTVSFMGIKS